MSSLRDQIAAANDRAEEVVDVPEWGVKVLLRELSGKQADNRLQSFIDAQVPDPHKPGDVRQHIPPFHREWLLVWGCHDPKTREPLFTADDSDMLSERKQEVLTRLGEKIQELSGLDEDAQDEALGKSDDAPRLATGTG